MFFEKFYKLGLIQYLEFTQYFEQNLGLSQPGEHLNWRKLSLNNIIFRFS